MRKIYLKNYKGFSDQIIELSDINFLVGENSTGKTSLLKIINLLSNSSFRFKFEFNNNEIELGFFEEIANKQSNEKTFQIGMEVDLKELEEGELFCTKILLTFKSLKSIPILDSFRFNIEGIDFFVKVTDKQIKYKKKNNNNNFEDWVKDIEYIGNFKTLSIPNGTLPFYFLLFFILQEEKKENNKHLISGLSLFQKYKGIAPMRVQPKRIYDSFTVNYSADGSHIPSLLNKILNEKTKRDKINIINIFENFGKESNLFDKIIIRKLSKSSSSPFEILVKYNDMEMELVNVGYGVSQSLPLIIEIINSKNTCFSIQQPEVHLHPKAQSAFGTLLFNSMNNNNNIFLIETHSDFIINKFRYNLSKNNTSVKKKKENKKINSKILFFERTKNGNKLTNIIINNDGTYENLPDSYNKFFIDEELKLLSI